MAKTTLKYCIVGFITISPKTLEFDSFTSFLQSTKGLSALFSCRVKCSEPQSARSLSLQAYSLSLLRNHNQSSEFTSEKHLHSFCGYFDVFLSAHVSILTTERRYLRKMSDKKQQKESVLSNTKIEQLSKQPIIESSVSKSEDGKWVIHRTIVTDIKPISYFEKVIAN